MVQLCLYWLSFRTRIFRSVFYMESMHCLITPFILCTVKSESLYVHTHSLVSPVTEAAASSTRLLELYLLFCSSLLPLIARESSLGLVMVPLSLSFFFFFFMSSLKNVLALFCMFWHHDFSFVCFVATRCSHYGVLCSGSGAGRPGWDVLQQLFPLCAVSAGPGPVQCPQPVGAQRKAGAGAIWRPSSTVTPPC